MKGFNSPKESLGDLDADITASLIAAAVDVSLVIDKNGVIEDLAFGTEDLSSEWAANWIGCAWIDTVTIESRAKVLALLDEARQQKPPRWRHVNHPSSWGTDVPIMYNVMRVGESGRTIAYGRDLRATAALQRRLIDAQQSMEREYVRLRHAETRYRLLFQTTSEAVLIVDASSRRILEANPAAIEILGTDSNKLIDKTFPDDLDIRTRQAVDTLMTSVKATGRAERVRILLGPDATELVLSASLFRQENAPLLLMRMQAFEANEPVGEEMVRVLRLAQLIEGAADAMVVTDAEGRIQDCNTAFLDIAQLATIEQARGETLDRWLGRPGVDLDVMLANLKQHSSVRLFATTIRGEYGLTTEIEVSAVSRTVDDRLYLGFTVRDVSRRLTSGNLAQPRLPRSVEQLTELVGRVPLKDIVRETTDVIERLCIEAALELTRDNRASAAEILGLSRQSLYVKLRRYGLGDLAGDADG